MRERGAREGGSIKRNGEIRQTEGRERNGDRQTETEKEDKREMGA